MPVRARRLIRKMRGGAQAHLIEAEDGGFYVLKSTNNPQHRRILINEWLSCVFLRYLQILVPDTALIELTPEFTFGQPELYLSLGSRRVAIPPGIHFGSRLAVHPDRVAIFDFLPDKLLYKLEKQNGLPGDAGLRQMGGKRGFASGRILSRPRQTLDALKGRSSCENRLLSAND